MMSKEETLKYYLKAADLNANAFWSLAIITGVIYAFTSGYWFAIPTFIGLC
jgi:hypothetical protein